VSSNDDDEQHWLLFAWSPSGYRLHELDGEPPETGAELEIDGQRLEIVKVAGSPLPDDTRPCAYSAGA
jgi:hypothetical protein